MDQQSYRCGRCTMGFAVVDEFQNTGEIARCPECKRTFHTSLANPMKVHTVTVSVRQRDIPSATAA